MSDTATAEKTEEQSAASEEMFDKAELTFFDSEDSHAGSVIGKMLTLFFFYTVIAMSLVAYWTFSVTGN